MFVTRTNTDIYNEIGDRLINETSLTKAKSPGSKVRALIAAFSDELGDLYSTLNTSMLMTYVSTATGSFLDYLGEIFNARRQTNLGATISSTHKIFKYYVIDGGTFGSINSGNSFLIPKGTVLSSLATSNKTIQFELDTDYLCDKDDTELWVGAISSGLGSRFNVGANVIRNQSFTSYTDSELDKLQITNVAAVVSAADIETDDQFRYRIIKQATAGEKANETAIRLALLSLPGVSNVYFNNYGYGIGTFVVYIKPIILSAGDDLLEQCEIQVETTAAQGIVPIVTYLKRIGIELELSITFAPNTTSLKKTQVLSLLKLNVMDYLANLEKDQPFIVNELVQRVMQTDESILNVGTANKPIDRIWMWKDTLINDGRYRQTLLGDLQPYYDEIITYEYSIDNPIRIVEKV